MGDGGNGLLVVSWNLEERYCFYLSNLYQNAKEIRGMKVTLDTIVFGESTEKHVLALWRELCVLYERRMI